MGVNRLQVEVHILDTELDVPFGEIFFLERNSLERHDIIDNKLKNNIFDFLNAQFKFP